jgi:hypothetical protein
MLTMLTMLDEDETSLISKVTERKRTRKREPVALVALPGGR